MVDADSQSGGPTELDCSRINCTIVDTHVQHVNDNGFLGQGGDMTSVTNMSRPTLVAGDVITVTADASTGNSASEASAQAELMLEHVGG